VVVLRGSGSWGEDILGGMFSRDRKRWKKTYFFCFVFVCGGRNSQWWLHSSSSQVLCGSSIRLGSVSVAVL
jgi:hypothetical protein